MRACSLGFRVRDKVGVGLIVWVSEFYVLQQLQPTESRIPTGPHFTHSRYNKHFLFSVKTAQKPSSRNIGLNKLT